MKKIEGAKKNSSVGLSHFPYALDFISVQIQWKKTIFENSMTNFFDDDNRYAMYRINFSIL